MDSKQKDSLELVPRGPGEAWTWWVQVEGYRTAHALARAPLRIPKSGVRKCVDAGEGRVALTFGEELESRVLVPVSALPPDLLARRESAPRRAGLRETALRLVRPSPGKFALAAAIASSVALILRMDLLPVREDLCPVGSREFQAVLNTALTVATFSALLLVPGLAYAVLRRFHRTQDQRTRDLAEAAIVSVFGASCLLILHLELRAEGWEAIRACWES